MLESEGEEPTRFVAIEHPQDYTLDYGALTAFLARKAKPVVAAVALKVQLLTIARDPEG